MNEEREKIKVIYFQRKPRPGFNYSIESIFDNVRNLLKNEIEYSVKYSSYYNDGYISKFLNIVEASLRQKKNTINHITGEVNFLNLLMHKKKVLLTIHDCRYVERKKGLQQKLIKWLYLKAPVKKAKYITAVSEATKNDIVRYTSCNPEKIKIIPNQVNSIFKSSPKIFNKQYPVILQVGAGENKNLINLIEALKDITCRLIIIGEPDNSILEKLKKNKINYEIKHNLPDEELYKEYIDCDIVTFVSTFEGFGMPIIEANAVERVVITSNISSMPEIAGDSACFVDPYNSDDIRKGILEIINDDDYREQLISNGKKNILRFNEKIIADAYYDLYKKIAFGFKNNRA